MTQLSNSSKNQISVLIDFIANMEFKDEVKADKFETASSARAASEYIAAVQGLDNLSDIERQNIISNYIEENEYYQQLFLKHDISYIDARLAEDLDIIKIDGAQAIKYSYLMGYRTLYKEVLKSFYRTNYVKAYETKDNYRNMCLMAMNLMTLLNILAKWLEQPFDIDLMDAEQLDRFMISFGIPFFINLPLKFRRLIARNLNRLITGKGTDKVIIDILDIFNFKNIEVFKYHLVRDAIAGTELEDQNKDWMLEGEEYSPMFYSHNIRTPSLNQAIRQEEYRKHDVTVLTTNDEQWNVPEEEIVTLNFEAVQTKLFSIETGFEIAKESMNTVFIMNLIKRVRTEYNDLNMLRLSIPSISQYPIDLQDILVAIQILTNDFNGTVDAISYSEETITGIYEYSTRNDPALDASLFPPLDSSISLKEIGQIGTLDANTILEANEINFGIHTSIEEELKRETNYGRYRKLQEIYNAKFIGKLNYELYSGVSTYYEYLEEANPDLAKVIADIRAIDEDDVRRYTLEEKLIELIEYITEYMDGFEWFFSSTSLSILSSYLRKAIDTFKSFTVTMRDLQIVILIREETTGKLFDELDMLARLMVNEDKLGSTTAIKWMGKNIRIDSDNIMMEDLIRSIFARLGIKEYTKNSFLDKMVFKALIETSSRLNSITSIGEMLKEVNLGNEKILMEDVLRSFKSKLTATEYTKNSFYENFIMEARATLAEKLSRISNIGLMGKELSVGNDYTFLEDNPHFRSLLPAFGNLYLTDSKTLKSSSSVEDTLKRYTVVDSMTKSKRSLDFNYLADDAHRTSTMHSYDNSIGLRETVKPLVRTVLETKRIMRSTVNGVQKNRNLVDQSFLADSFTITRTP